MDEVTLKLLHDASCHKGGMTPDTGQQCRRPTPTFKYHSVEDIRAVLVLK